MSVRLSIKICLLSYQAKINTKFSDIPTTFEKKNLYQSQSKDAIIENSVFVLFLSLKF